MNDLRLAVRTLSKSPGFTFAATGLLAAGIGVTTLIFSAVDAILLRPLPVSHPEQLVRMVQRVPRAGTISAMPYHVYENLRDHSTTLSSVFGEYPIDLSMSEPEPAEQVRVHFTTPEFFDQLGVRAQLGRTLSAADANESDGAPPAVLSYGFWARRFQSDPGAIGKTIRLSHFLFVVAGVLPRGFNGVAADTAPDVCVPFRTLTQIGSDPEQEAGGRQLDLAGRLKPGVTLARAEEETRALWAAVPEHTLGWGPDYPLELDPLEHGTSILRDRYATALRFLIACAGFLLLMVCANVSGLLLARAAVRRQEIAVRLAVGATRAKLVRQMLVESAVLAVLASGCGAGIAALSAPLLARMLPPMHDLGSNRLLFSLNMGVDGRVLLFSLGASIATVMLFGLTPAAAASRTSLDSILRSARSTSSLRGRQALILLQVALCTLLLSGAALLIRTFQDLHSLNPGFDPSHVASFTLNPATAGYTQDQERVFSKSLLVRIHEIPGITHAALAGRGVMRDRGLGMTVAPAGHSPTRADVVATNGNGVTPEYFETMGMRLVSGRLFTDADIDSKVKPEKVVVNESFVRRYFPDTDPIGKLFGGTAPGEIAAPDRQIVGVVADAKYRSLREPMMPTSFGLDPYQSGLLVVYVRTRGNPQDAIWPVRRALATLDRALPIVEVDTLAAEVDASAAGERLTATLGTIFAVLAVLLSAAGIYGLLAYAVVQRRREIGVRIVLGATRLNIGGWIGRQAIVTVLAGVALGLAGARAVGPLIASLLYGVSPSDARSFAGAALIVLAMAVLASAVPAARAALTEPASALRED